MERLDQNLPGLSGRLNQIPWEDRETSGRTAIEAFRISGGAGLVIEESLGGIGADLATAVSIQRAIGSLSPSLAIASTMHHFSIATLNALVTRGSGMESLLLQAIAEKRLLMASGFAEGRSGSSILSSVVEARRDGDDYLVTGSKKPCSLSRSMDVLSATAEIPSDDGHRPRLIVLLIPASSPGITVRPFWDAPVLRGAESDEVVLEQVRVPASLAVEIGTENLDFTQKVGFVWFEMLICASYLGVASRLVEMSLVSGRGSDVEVSRAVCAVESAAQSLEGVARRFSELRSDDDSGLEWMLAATLMARYQAQSEIVLATDLCSEILGGGAFIKDSRVPYLYTAARALAFHPPSRSAMASRLVSYLGGKELMLP
jgi:alkylation response protein AidB-like acyl-CoA dehydrogenase